jgi:hypothetical protein
MKQFMNYKLENEMMLFSRLTLKMLMIKSSGHYFNKH